MTPLQETLFLVAVLGIPTIATVAYAALVWALYRDLESEE